MSDGVPSDFSRQLERENVELRKKLEDAAAQLAAFDSHHCESEGCAVEGLYKPIAAEWADKYHAMKKRIAELERELAEANKRIAEMEQRIVQVQSQGVIALAERERRIAELERELAAARQAQRDEDVRLLRGLDTARFHYGDWLAQQPL